jgi:hypothetical protein
MPLLQRLISKDYPEKIIHPFCSCSAAPRPDAGEDAQEDPERELTLEVAHGFFVSVIHDV